MDHERAEDLPRYIKWTMTFINRIGFPILVCIWLAYQQFISGKETLRALEEFKAVIGEVRVSLDNNTETQKRLIEMLYRTRR